MKLNIKWVIAILSVVVIFSGCGKKSGDSRVNKEGQESNSDSELVIARGADIRATDPHDALGTPTANVVFHVFNSLTRTEHDGEVLPDLAESYEAINDTTWRFELKEDVKFQNGEDFNANAVKYSIERMLNPDHQFGLSGDFSFIEEVVVVDEYTVDIKTEEPFDGLPLRMFYLAMVPPEYIEEHGDDYFAENPVGTGPYKFVEWKKGEHVILEANQNYFDGAPEFKKVTIKPISEDASRVAALEAGEVDIISGLPTSEIERIESTQGIKMISHPTTRVMYVGLNVNEHEIMQDKKIRQAMNYAVNVDSIIENILNGIGEVYSSFVSPGYFKYADDVNKFLEPYEYDPDKAKKLMEESGYNGEPLQLSYSPGSNLNDKPIVEAIAGQLKEVGFTIEVIEKESGLFSEDIQGGTVEPLYYNGLGGPYASEELLSRIAFDSDGRYSNYTNPRLDKIREEASQTLEREKAADLWREFQEELFEEAPAIFLHLQYEVYGYNEDIEWNPRPDETILSQNASLKYSR